ncbi:ARM repeat superfamily protein, putative isoform 3 [Hibiscus syriacus]|uniref:ARM repeat superfamily protein, putative isoform 3 n=1 Tax=Hibiscus syriacus TaxID=106335 RepID=A0A6A2ZL97_HIBSY|nr:TORTIFOLIA1-like protein 4 [Hibiscus syriacus]KAE8692346.1 ARM repeat superfamily protein, putative isoform 3 [Hibiscus syriacus]
MSFKNRTLTTPLPQPQDFKLRVCTCLNRLADRDTLAVASAELESIARNLTVDSIAPFLNCLHNTDSSSKSPVRRQCVSLLALLSRSHGNALSPHFSKMVSTLSRRLRDPDSSVRSTCVEASAAMSSHITKPPFSVLSKPLIEMLVVEQDANSQVGAAMCLAAAIEAAPDPETEQLRNVLPKLGKLVRNESFKAKAAVFGVIGSVASVGGAGSKGILDWLVPCGVEALSSEDWATRKASAEALGKLVRAEKELTMEFKSACVAALENRRFDKVKIVRETMNRSLDLWKEVSGVSEDGSIPSQSESSSFDNVSFGCFPSVAKSVDGAGFRTPQSKKVVPISRSPPSDSSTDSTAKKETPARSNNRNVNASTFCRLDRTKPSYLKTEIVEPRKSLFFEAYDNIKNSDFGVLETKRLLFASENDEECGGLKSGSRVVPFHVDKKNAAAEVGENPKKVEGLILIRERLAQIEDQQSNLLNLLQKFIGSSQSGINSLETRVNSLEMALDEMSYDLAVSSGRIPNMDSADNTCCKLPGTEFLSPKFWRKTEGWFSTSRLSSSGRMVYKDSGAETYKPAEAVSQRHQHQDCGGFIMNPAADGCGGMTENSGFFSNRLSNDTIRSDERVRVGNSSGADGTTLIRCPAPINLRSR